MGIPPLGTPRKTLRLGLLMVSSALVGGIATALWHRKTLTKLQNLIPPDEILKVDGSDDGEFRED